MRCERFQADLALLPTLRVLAELPQNARDHVADCESCRAAVLERIRIDRLLDRVPHIEPPAAFVDNVVAAALDDEDRAAPRSRWSPHVRVAAAAALVLGAIGIGLWLVRDARRDPGERSVASVETEPPAELLANLDLFLDDWDEVVEHRESLDLIAGLEMAKALDLIEEDEAR